MPSHRSSWRLLSTASWNPCEAVDKLVQSVSLLASRRPHPLFVPLPLHDVTTLAEVFRRAVLRLFVRRELMDVETAQGMLAWPHSGFHVHDGVWVAADDRELAVRMALTETASVFYGCCDSWPRQSTVRRSSTTHSEGLAFNSSKKFSTTIIFDPNGRSRYHISRSPADHGSRPDRQGVGTGIATF